MVVVITPLYAGLLAVLLVALSVHTIRERRRAQAALGDRGAPLLKRAVRAHGNFTEYVPLSLLMLLMIELTQHPLWLLHALGLGLLIGRASHAFGITRAEENFRWRIFGMFMTFGVLLISAAVLLVHSASVVVG
jgi:uncharacterized membrane protein YecN with MAPEG domain